MTIPFDRGVTLKMIEIVYLADHPDLIQTCASWAYSQWGCQSNGSLEHSIEKFTKGASKGNIPLTLVALLNQKPAGMISLWTSDFDKRPDLSPWLASLYVHPFHRNNHIATALIKRLESEAQLLEYSELFLVTEEAKNLYVKFGWVEIDQVETSYSKASLMKKGLNRK